MFHPALGGNTSILPRFGLKWGYLPLQTCRLGRKVTANVALKIQI
jgi:hypothetical protein